MSFDYELAYRMLYLIRRTEEEIVTRYHRDSLMRCPTHLSIGQEASAVGVMMALQPEDRVWAYHRCHAHYLAKGGDLDAMVAELHGKAIGCAGGWGGSMHLADESVGFTEGSTAVGNCTSIAVGAAFANNLEGNGKVVATFFGDATVETGQFWESVNFASLHHLPIMFVCENNLYSTATPLNQRQPDSPIYKRLKEFMWSAQVSDENIENIHTAALKCREAGPGFLEVSTYRFLAHVGPNFDWDLGYRTEEEVRGRMAQDTLPEVRGKIKESVAEEIEYSVTARVLLAFERAEAAPWPEAIGV
jgi:TPP-dependent pyruvate/acetoin dehydrogenase alpha subunit